MVKCILCGKEKVKFIAPLKEKYDWLVYPEEINIYDCENCDTRFIDPLLNIDYNFIYEKTGIYYNEFERVRRLKLQEDPSWDILSRGHPYYGVFDFIKGKKNLEILDIGCGYGGLVFVLNIMGHKAIGLEVSRQAVYFAAGLFGDNYFQLDIDSFIEQNPDKKYDLIIAIEVIEHLIDPMNFVRKCLSCIKEKGSLLITTPNRDYNQIFPDRKENQSDWIMDKPPIHLAIYNKKAMEYIAFETKTNLSTVSFPGLAEITGPTNLVAIFKK